MTTRRFGTWYMASLRDGETHLGTQFSDLMPRFDRVGRAWRAERCG